MRRETRTNAVKCSAGVLHTLPEYLQNLQGVALQGQDQQAL